MLDAASTLTNLARIARRREHARAWLTRAFQGRRLDELAESALEVAIETGDPIGEVLAEAVDGAGSIALAERLARTLVDDDRFSTAVPLRKLAIVANRKMLRHLEAAWPEPDPSSSRRSPSWLTTSHPEQRPLDSHHLADALHNLVSRKSGSDERSRLLGHT